MRLNRETKLYVALITVLAAVSVYACFVLPGDFVQGAWLDYVLYGALGLLAGGRKVVVFKSGEGDDTGSMSLGFVVTFAAMLGLGFPGAVFTALITSFSACLYPQRQKPVQILFNVSLGLVEAALGSAVFFLINGGPNLTGVSSMPALAASATTYFAVNTFGVSGIISLVSGQKFWQMWRESFMWTAPSFYAGAAITSLALSFGRQNFLFFVVLLVPVIVLIHQTYAGHVARMQEKQDHIEELQKKQAELAELYLATIKSLALAIDAKDRYTHQHILRVQRYSLAIAEAMNLPKEELEAIKTGALLHDIGKLGVPEYVLLKPGRLTNEEFDKIKKHPEIGAAILEPVEFPWPVLPIVRHHHEKWDGTGYPDGLKGEDIPLNARIMAVADVYDALTSTRSYRNAWSHEKAKGVIIEDAGTHFDPEVVKVFESVIDGVVERMAEENEGPLCQSHETDIVPKADEEAASDIARASSELWALYEIAQLMSAGLSLAETLGFLTGKLGTIFPNLTCLVLVRQEKSDTMRVGSGTGPQAELFEDGMLTAKLDGACNKVRVFTIDDWELDPKSGRWPEAQEQILLPLVYQGEEIGAIAVIGTLAGDIDSNQASLLQMMSDRIAAAVFNAQLYERTRGDAMTDPLTGLYNLRYATQFINEKALRGHRVLSEDVRFEPSEEFAVLLLDLDNFKPINDNFGHTKGDEVLRDLARIFKQAVGPKNIVARYGGDEFLVILQTSSCAAEAERVGRELEELVAAYDPGLIHVKLGRLHVGVSCGHACYPKDGETFNELVSHADKLMYARKSERKLASLQLPDSDQAS